MEIEDPLAYPLLGYGAGLIGQAVTLSLEVSQTASIGSNGQGTWNVTIMTPEQALAIGELLIALSQSARSSALRDLRPPDELT